MDRAEPTQALEQIWQRVRRLNRYVEERAPWQLARDPANAEQLDRVLASLVEGLRTVNVLLRAVHARDDGQAARSHLAHPEGAVAALEPLFPKQAVIDSHTHLHLVRAAGRASSSSARSRPA